jgi:hypothetical protein
VLAFPACGDDLSIVRCERMPDKRKNEDNYRDKSRR